MNWEKNWNWKKNWKNGILDPLEILNIPQNFGP